MSEKEILESLNNEHSRSRGFAQLMELYQRMLYWHIRRLVVTHEDAQDVLQETFINAYRHIDSFKGRSSLKTWLYTIATNEALRLYRKAKIDTQSYDENNRLLELINSDTSIDYNSVEAKLQRAVLSLPEKQRIVFNLRYWDEMEYEEIAKITGQKVGTLKTNYHYANEKVKQYMLNHS